MDEVDLAQLTQQVYEIAVEAGTKIMEFYSQLDSLVPQLKSDASPLTIADQTAHEIITQGLSTLTTTIPVLSEEGRQIPFVERQRWEQYWCVDPLDGTKDFLKRNDEFTVNIALIRQHIPVIGVVYVPAQQKGYVAWSGGGAYCWEGLMKRRLHVKQPVIRPWRVMVSRYHGLEALQHWLAVFGEIELMHQGSALKFCTLASGEADIFLRLSPSSEWDNAAGQCVLEEAGGQVYSLDGRPLAYNHSGTLEQRPFIAVGDRQLDMDFFSKLPCG